MAGRGIRTVFVISLFAVMLISGCETLPRQSTTSLASKIPNGIYHQVQEGDTLWRIAEAYGVGVADIVRANNLSGYERISSGQRLFVPGPGLARSINLQKVKLYEKDLFIWPVKGDLLSCFNQVVYGARNKGIDIKTAEKDQIVASKGGKVVFCAEAVKGFGKMIIIDHLDGFSTIYARNGQNLVKVGDNVGQSQVIAKAGATGRSPSTYLHFEIRRRHKAQNPLFYLP
ncbi:MAG: peptidoglycan DD-metalloendopeptidase family protein [Candidatus Omnitrophota bacterium]